MLVHIRSDNLTRVPIFLPSIVLMKCKFRCFLLDIFTSQSLGVGPNQLYCILYSFSLLFSSWDMVLLHFLSDQISFVSRLPMVTNTFLMTGNIISLLLMNVSTHILDLCYLLVSGVGETFFVIDNILFYDLSKINIISCDLFSLVLWLLWGME